jgi:hypothetical protein
MAQHLTALSDVKTFFFANLLLDTIDLGRSFQVFVVLQSAVLNVAAVAVL